MRFLNLKTKNEYKDKIQKKKSEIYRNRKLQTKKKKETMRLDKCLF